MSSQCGKKLCKTKSGIKLIPIKDTDRCPFELAEPEWMKDDASIQCKNCNVKFSLLTRRHHCRRCGLLLCSSCSDNNQPLPRMCFLDPVRHCNSCAKVTIDEKKFYDEELKILTTGAVLNLSFNDLTPDCTAVCSISPNHRTLIMDKCKRQSLPLHRLINESNVTDSSEYDYKEMNILVRGEGLEVKLVAPTGTISEGTASYLEAERSEAFLSALDHALVLKEESRSVIGA